MNGLTVYVRTRTQVLDYRFIGKQPPMRWWEDTFGRWTDFSRPTVIVEADHFFIAGIPSTGRTDSKGAGIHYALAADITSEQAREWAARAMRRLCARVGHRGGWEELGAGLDDVGDEIWAAAANGDDRAVETVMGAVEKLLDAESSPQQSPVLNESWSSGQGEDNFRKLGETAAAIIAQATEGGLAAFLNLASANEVNSICRQRRPVGLIYPEGDPHPKVCAPDTGAKLSRWQRSWHSR